MISNSVVEVEARKERGKNANRRLRRAGRVPGVVYGMGLDPFAISVSPKRVLEILQTDAGRNSIFTLALEGADAKQSRAAMIKDLQRDPVSQSLIHVDFVRVDLDKKVTVDVPLRIVGVPFGVKNEGGMLDFVHRQVEVECLPGNIPEHIDLDVTELHVNQHLSVKDLVVTGDFAILDDPESTVVSVSVLKAEPTPVEEAAEAVAAAATEPEVAAKGKPEESSKED